MQVLVDVSREDLDAHRRQRRKSAFTHPIAVAVARATGRRCGFSGNALKLTPGDRIPAPACVLEKSARLDAGLPVRPFSFFLETEECHA